MSLSHFGSGSQQPTEAFLRYQVSNIVNLISSTSSEGDEVINSRALSLLEEMLSV